MRAYTIIFIASLFVVTTITILLASFVSDSKSDNAKYSIVSGNNKTYYANTFRMFGRGIIFDDVYGNKIILTGNIDIEYKQNN